MSASLTVTVRHELPGRLRLRLSLPLRDAAAFDRALRTHAGIAPTLYNARTRSLLLHFNPGIIRREELLVRVALAFSLEHEHAPVRIEAASPRASLSASVTLSGLLLLAGGAARAGNARALLRKRLERLAGVATATAVLGHAAQELRRNGAYHPEVVSVAYLAVGMLRGNTLPAAVVTWLATFGRHLFEPQPPAVEVRPGAGGQTAEVVTATPARSAQPTWTDLLPSLLRALTGANRSGSGLLESLQEVSRLHDQVLDALGPWKQGIALQFDSHAPQP